MLSQIVQRQRYLDISRDVSIDASEASALDEQRPRFRVRGKRPQPEDDVAGVEQPHDSEPASEASPADPLLSPPREHGFVPRDDSGNGRGAQPSQPRHGGEGRRAEVRGDQRMGLPPAGQLQSRRRKFKGQPFPQLQEDKGCVKWLTGNHCR